MSESDGESMEPHLESGTDEEILLNYETSGSISEKSFLKAQDKLRKQEFRRERKEKRKQNIQYSWYVLSYFIVAYLTYFIPIVLFFVYFHFLFRPEYLAIGLHPLDAFRTLRGFLLFSSLPVMAILLYGVYLFLNILLIGILYHRSERLQPSQKGVYERTFEGSFRILKFYHYRGFLTRFIKWKVMNGLFPWLMPWVWNYLGVGKVGKGTTFEDHYLGCELFNLGTNSYMGYGAISATHAIEGVFGRVVIAGTQMGNGVTVGPRSVVGPDANIGNGAHVLFHGALPKAYILREGNYYMGRPVIKLTRGRIRQVLGIPKKKKS